MRVEFTNEEMTEARLIMGHLWWKRFADVVVDRYSDGSPTFTLWLYKETKTSLPDELRWRVRDERDMQLSRQLDAKVWLKYGHPHPDNLPVARTVRR